ARASLIAAGRRKLPTWSARNGGLVLVIALILTGRLRREFSASKGTRANPASRRKEGELSRLGPGMGPNRVAPLSDLPLPRRPPDAAVTPRWLSSTARSAASSALAPS